MAGSYPVRVIARLFAAEDRKTGRDLDHLLIRGAEGGAGLGLLIPWEVGGLGGKWKQDRSRWHLGAG